MMASHLAVVPDSLRASVYARVSKDSRGRDDKRRGRSPREQLAHGSAWCEREGWEIVSTWEDVAVSASRYATRSRDGWAEVIAAIDAGEMDILILWALSRADRKLDGFVRLREICQRKGVLIGIDGRVYDMRNGKDRVDLADQAVTAERDSEIISAGACRALAANAAVGSPHGRIPFGYARPFDAVTGERGEQVILETEARLVREGARRLLRGESVRGIVDDWSSRGVVGKTGRPFSRSAFRAMITNPAYNGLRVYRGKVVGKGAWEAILGNDTFDALTALFADPSRNNRPSSPRVNLLTGFSRCGICGGPLNVSKHGADLSYRCAEARCVSRKVSDLDAYVEATVIAAVKRGEIGLPDNDAPASRAARERIETLRFQLEDAYQAMKAGGPEGMKATTYARLESDWSAEIDALTKTLTTAHVPTIARDLLAADDPDAYYDALTREEARAILRAMVDVVVRPVTKRGPVGFDASTVNVTPKPF
jgi:site-specific DNA recombinase